MRFEVDPVFQNSGRKAKSRRRRRTGARMAWGLTSGLVLTAAFWLAYGLIWTGPDTDLTGLTEEGGIEAEPGDEFSLVQSEETAHAAVEIDQLTSFIDLRRDPMILRFATGDMDKTQPLDAPQDFARGRLGHHGQGAIIALKDSLFVAEKRLVTTLPSSRDDFALFKAQRALAFEAETSGKQGAVDAGHLVQVREESSWGNFISNDTDVETGAEVESGDEAAVYVETRIENTTSVAVTLRESQRQPLYEDAIRVLRADRALADMLRDDGISEREANAIVRAIEQKLGLTPDLPADSILALRLRPGSPEMRLMLMSIYGPEGYRASLAQVGAGRFEPAADPWISDDLIRRSGQVIDGTERPGDVRLLDAVYSAALRNGISTKLVGELIVALSQKHDLDRFVVEGDEIVILQASTPGVVGGGMAQVLYAGIHSPSGKMPCYMLEKPDGSGYSCFDFDAPPLAGGGGAGGLGGGLLVPVNGVKTSGFGPRHHPILKQVRNHNGVDWAAPTGTPVQAVAAGTILLAGNGGGYGNVVYIDHGNGIETRYAHLDAFAKGLKKGKRVTAGELIGAVGTTGRSTGPHLHFELRVKGQPVNPLTYAGAVAGGGAQAVEALVNQIIRVESAGVATAKNPRSTATGLGQFIQSTWLRMMRDYRPDLVNSMTTAQLLALRTDPALSREMVRNLARENEAFLRARGHQITAGRLYLAHFLGPAGADKALRADPGATVLAVMGAQVVNANPFLRNKTIADLRNWSDRKMRGAKGGTVVVASTPRVAVIPEEVKAYRATVEALLAEL